MHTIRQFYQWKTNITRFPGIDIQIFISKKTSYHHKIAEEQSWLGIG